MEHRRNIFELIQQNNSIELDIKRIHNLCFKEYSINVGMMKKTVIGFFEHFCFDRWKHKGHCLDIDDLLLLIDYDGLKDKASEYEDSLFTYIEFIYNIWIVTDNRKRELQQTGNRCTCTHKFIVLKEIMDDVLSKYNHKAVYLEENKQVLIMEDKPEVTAVAQIINEELVYPLLQYNHRSLKGDLKSKKSVLLSLGTDLEPKRQKLSEINKELTISIFYMLNNLNIRHNNVSKGDSNYKEYVANMSPDKIEEWYDELYQMMLLAYLMLDNVDRKKRFDDLKKEIEGAGNGQAENAQ